MYNLQFLAVSISSYFDSMSIAAKSVAVQQLLIQGQMCPGKLAVEIFESNNSLSCLFIPKRLQPIELQNIDELQKKGNYWLN